MVGERTHCSTHTQHRSIPNLSYSSKGVGSDLVPGAIAASHLDSRTFSLASALFGILRQLLQSPDSPSGFILPFLFFGMGYGEFLSPNVFAYLMEMAFGLLAGLMLGVGVRRDRILIYLAVALVVWTALVLSNTRGGIL